MKTEELLAINIFSISVALVVYYSMWLYRSKKTEKKIKEGYKWH